MPFYDYMCTVCGHEVEVRHSVHGHGPSECPKCGSPMKKAISSPTVLYKGSGWARKEKGTGRSSKAAPKETDAASAGTAHTDGSGAGSTVGDGAGTDREHAHSVRTDKAGSAESGSGGSSSPATQTVRKGED
jgi:putative FmdB family regulatory protein